MKKLLIASDLHGSAYYTRFLMDRICEEEADRVLLLGDLLYHGPRNDLPREYAPKEVIAMLNGIRNHILAVRGNCDTEVDQMVLEFPIMADYAMLYVEGYTMIAVHGHHAGEAAPPPHRPGDILLAGHTHIPCCHEHEDFIYMNPGSVSIPKEGSRHSYMTLESGRFLWKDVENGEIWMEKRI
ncbi:MAG: phosphodiesterase [Lachnospiraceae bacterium]|nr:phosphodiesterase [Lachnospiraceae bacterium]